MLTSSQLAALAGKFKINASVVLREYIQDPKEMKNIGKIMAGKTIQEERVTE